MVVVLAMMVMAVVLMVRVQVMNEVWYFECIRGCHVAVIGEVLVRELMVEVAMTECWTAAAVTAVAS